jgi:hypothetical protein
MKILCLMGLHNWLCDFTDTNHPKLLLQFFKCGSCGKQKPYCGFISLEALNSYGSKNTSEKE